MIWIYNGKIFTEAMIGENVAFVYEIVNISNGRRYIGKKSFTKSKTYQKNKKKKRTRVASDWISYTGSNDELNQDINSGHEVSRTILHLCETKGWASYLETKEILNRDCLLSDKYYNKWCSLKIRNTHLRKKKEGKNDSQSIESST